VSEDDGHSRSPLFSFATLNNQFSFSLQNFNRFYSERPGYWLQRKPFLKELKGKVEEGEKEVFYDSSTGKLLFTAPIDRSWEDWIQETRDHGWPSFRDNEVNWENVRVLPNGETVSVDGTHLVSRIHNGDCNPVDQTMQATLDWSHSTAYFSFDQYLGAQLTRQRRESLLYQLSMHSRKRDVIHRIIWNCK